MSKPNKKRRAKLKRSERQAELARQAAGQIARRYIGGIPDQLHPRRGENASANRAMEQTKASMRAEARYRDENDDRFVSILNWLIDRIIGQGIQAIPTVTLTSGAPAAITNASIRQWWRGWTERPEVTQTYSWGKAQRLVMRTKLRDGEQLTRHIEGRTFPWLDIPYALQLLEPDYLPFEKTTTNADSGRQIVQGVEVDEWGRPVSYHLYPGHPGDLYPVGIGLNRLIEIDAEFVIHVKHVKRLQQIRGVTAFHPILRRLDDIWDGENLERIAMRVAAAFTGFIKKPADFSMMQSSKQGDLSFEMAPGMIWGDLPPGADVGTISHNRPNNLLIEFTKQQMRQACGAVNAAYSGPARDFDGSYSSQRQEEVESRQQVIVQQTEFLDDWYIPIRRRALEHAVRARLINMEPNVDLDTLYDAVYRGPAPITIDPLKETNARVLLIRNKLASRWEVMIETGRDPEQTDRQIAADPLLETLDNQPDRAPARPAEIEDVEDEADRETATG